MNFLLRQCLGVFYYRPQRSVIVAPPPALVAGFSLRASARLAGVGVSVIDAYPRELLYLTVGDIALDYVREGQVGEIT